MEWIEGEPAPVSILLAQHATDDLQTRPAQTFYDLSQVVPLKLPADTNAQRALVALALVDLAEDRGRFSRCDLFESTSDSGRPRFGKSKRDDVCAGLSAVEGRNERKTGRAKGKEQR